jgi:hypothetical protein
MAISYRVVADMSSGWHSHSIIAQVAIGEPSAYFLWPQARTSLVRGSRSILLENLPRGACLASATRFPIPSNRGSKPTVRLLTHESMLGGLPTRRWPVWFVRTTSIPREGKRSSALLGRPLGWQPDASSATQPRRARECTGRLLLGSLWVSRSPALGFSRIPTYSFSEGCPLLSSAILIPQISPDWISKAPAAEHRMRQHGQHSQIYTPPRSLEWSEDVVPVPAQIGMAILSLDVEPRFPQTSWRRRGSLPAGSLPASIEQRLGFRSRRGCRG